MSAKQYNIKLGVNDMKNYKVLIRQLLSEFLGTMLYLALVLSSGVTDQNVDENSRILLLAFANGLLVASAIAIFGHVSGAHINPAVTLGALVCRTIKPLKALCYILVQILGSLAGAAIAYAVSSENTRGDLGVINFDSNLTATQAFVLEFLMTFVLVAVFLSVSDPKRGVRGLGSAALAIGMTLTACICACGTYTACLNPVRSLGPAVIMGLYHNHWVYWAGPMIGGWVAGISYKYLLSIYLNELYVSPIPSRVNSRPTSIQMT